MIFAPPNRSLRTKTKTKCELPCDEQVILQFLKIAEFALSAVAVESN